MSKPGSSTGRSQIAACRVGAAAFLVLCLSAPIPVSAAECGANPKDGIDWTGCRKRNLMIDGSKLNAAMLAEADFTSTDLRKSELSGADLQKSTLVRSMLDNSNAAGANFEKAVGFRTSFVQADLSGAKFGKSEMQRADFTSANVTNVDFEKSELGRAIFTDATIDGAAFRFANLARADFRGAKFSSALDFEGAYFYRTRIEGVDLSKAVGLMQWQVDLACGDDATLLPEGVGKPESWPCGDE